MKCMYYESENNKIKCLLCPHGCTLLDGQYGRCMARQNLNGQLINHNYGKITAIAMDPIEKKPLKRYYPGEMILSVGFWGCNFRCSFCQNYNISMKRAPQQNLSVDQLIKLVLDQDCLGIAFTYNEPLINFEYIYDVSKELKKISDKKVVLVTNGYINEAPLRELLPFVDAMNIDLKSFTNTFYKDICSGTISPVLNTIKIASGFCHVEVTTLIIPTLNDTVENIESLAKFLADIDPRIPLHLSAYYPRYKLNLPPTSKEKLLELQAVCKKHLIDVFLGNI